MNKKVHKRVAAIEMPLIAEYQSKSNTFDEKQLRADDRHSQTHGQKQKIYVDLLVACLKWIRMCGSF